LRTQSARQLRLLIFTREKSPFELSYLPWHHKIRLPENPFFRRKIENTFFDFLPRAGKENLLRTTLYPRGRIARSLFQMPGNLHRMKRRTGIKW